MTPPETEVDEQFDVVIVGAGSAGCVLAARLSEDPKLSVLLLEAGPKDRHLAIRVPAAFPTLFEGRLDWAYRTLPQRELAGRQVYWPRGRVLGGSSSINAMMWVRGFRADYEEWAGIAGPSWSADSLLPYFLRAEDTADANGTDPLHGSGGPLPVSSQRDPNPLTAAWLDACSEVGISLMAAPNSGADEGVGLAPVNQRRGRRVSAADGYLRPALRRRNLVVRTGALVDRLVCEGRRVGGVRYRIGRTLRTASARVEVVLAAGTIGSPLLLMRSGIGPGSDLTRAGVGVVADRPAVGRNLQDHLTAGFACSISDHRSLASARKPRAVLRYAIARRGLLTSNVAEGFGFVRSRDDLELPDLELLFVPGLFLNEGLDLPSSHGCTLGAVLLRPVSRGAVSLGDGADAPPAIDPAYLSDPSGEDARTLGIGVARCLEIARAPSLSQKITGVVQPVGRLEDDLVETSLHRYAQTLYHPVGTCAMGRDAAAVVDESLLVRGISGLRVVDASVMPVIPRGHTHAPTIAIAERAAELIAAATR